FRGESALEILQQVCSREPLPPSRLHPGLPYDLETICEKCLRKEPHERYATADRLADDLRNFLAGRPIEARRTRTWERGLKWCRRRPTDAALVAVSALALGVCSVLAWQGWAEAGRVERVRADVRAHLDAGHRHLADKEVDRAREQLT